MEQMYLWVCDFCISIRSNHVHTLPVARLASKESKPFTSDAGATATTIQKLSIDGERDYWMLILEDVARPESDIQGEVSKVNWGPHLFCASTFIQQFIELSSLRS
ncbi:hypothetical protein CBL_12419 [Carabus blaptoides fortunei]